MTRAISDTTSTCGSCSYWSHEPKADGLHATRLGYCQWISVPAWVHKCVKAELHHQKMREDDGSDCWLHTKRGEVNRVEKLEKALREICATGSNTHQEAERMMRELAREALSN
jgi:hypothetical protein